MHRGVCAYASLAALFVLAVSVLAWREYGRIAAQDDWRLLHDLYTTPFLGWLFSDQNGHRVPLTLLVYAADYVLLSGRYQLLVAGSLTCALLAVAAMARVVGSGREGWTPGGVAAISFFGFGLFWSGYLHNFRVGLQLCTLQAILFAVLALAALIECASRQRDARPGAGLLLGACIVAGVLCTYSFGTGLAVWPALFAVALVARLPRRTVATLVVFAAAALMSFAMLPGGNATTSPAWVLRSLGEPLVAARYAAAFVGSVAASLLRRPLGLEDRAAVDLAAVLGGLAVLGAAFHGLSLRRRRTPAAPADLFGVGLMAFVAVAALLVSLARSPLDPDGALHVRFVIWSVLFLQGVVFALSARVARDRLPWMPRAFVFGLVLLSLALLPPLLDQRARARRQQDRIELAAAALMLGVHSPSLTGGMTIVDPSTVFETAPILARDRRNLFAEPRARLPGTRLLSSFSLVPADRCPGRVSRAQTLDAVNGPASLVSGWVSKAAGGTPRFIALTDRHGRVVGLGNVLGQPSLTGPAPRPDMLPWMAVVGRAQAGEPPLAYAVLSDSIACPIGPAPESEP